MVAELKSYQKPPYPVFEVMTATLLLVGYSEKDLKQYDQIKAALAKTGKECKGSGGHSASERGGEGEGKQKLGQG